MPKKYNLKDPIGTYICLNCGKEFKRYKCQIVNNEKVFCSRKCRYKKQKTSLLGNKNPNFKTGKYCCSYYCEVCGKEIDKQGRSKKCHQCKYLHYKPFKGKKHSEKSKKIIGQKSREKFTPEYKKRLKKTMQERGYWIDDNTRTDFELYKKLANWICHMFNYSSEKEINLLHKYGIFNSKTNRKGVVRDHKLSRKTGFDKKIFPQILRHPLNCKIISNKENITKRNKNTITIKNLFKSIQNYDKGWKEQTKCLMLIDLYKIGIRWERKVMPNV